MSRVSTNNKLQGGLGSPHNIGDSLLEESQYLPEKRTFDSFLVLLALGSGNRLGSGRSTFPLASPGNLNSFWPIFRVVKVYPDNYTEPTTETAAVVNHVFSV